MIKEQHDGSGEVLEVKKAELVEMEKEMETLKEKLSGGSDVVQEISELRKKMVTLSKIIEELETGELVAR